MSRRQKRPTNEYLAAAKRLAKFVPALRKYKRRKTLKPSEKAAIARREKQLRYTDHLIPVNKKLAKKLKKQLVAPGVSAVQLRNTGKHTTIHSVNRDMMVTSNGRTWLYWTLDRDKVSNRKKFEDAAEDAFDNEFPTERIAELARKAYTELRPMAVYLWAPTGRVGRGFDDFPAFQLWLYENWNQGSGLGQSRPENWINGLAILLHEGDHEEDNEDED